ncbi:energy-coupling factor ABC transporter ATP-binding protein [Paenibacillus sp. N1-5-1-14]|uniref:ABC transporter ATP-binding protein n=1 Tax=Paenibacillus radicibacter TaxID=2972488 RepID=UPI0021594078|nr:ABC transporter ATP-binding protein [Paenibacillus radicibacter]MCR8641108.1 energy-coupling factor ABC transporter ATP-binding protein [Paenibacillus radicibacter]
MTDASINAPMIELRDVSFTFEGETEPTLHQLDLKLHAGEWINIVGANGSGKTTLSHMLHPILQAQLLGALHGRILFQENEASSLSKEKSATYVGIVLQSADVTFVQEIVEHELAFGPENMRISTIEISDRIDEVLRQVGMEGARYRRIDELSGGQKQRIAIASMLMMQPKVLVLDDVTASLDADATKQLVETLHDLHQAGHTIVTTSSRLEDRVIEHASRLIVIDDGEIVEDGSVNDVLTCKRELLIRSGCMLEDASIQYLKLEDQSTIMNRILFNDINNLDNLEMEQHPLLKVEGLSYCYPSKGVKSETQSTESYVFNDINLMINPHDLIAIMGANGSGKTTLGKILGGLIRPKRGMIFTKNNDLATMPIHEITRVVGYIFQDPEHQFVTDRVIEECIFGLKMRLGLQPWDASPPELLAQGEAMLKRVGLWEHREKYPYTLSSGEKRLLSMASIMILEPAILVLDEPTAGQDYKQAGRLIALCDAYRKEGKAVLMITHDHQMVRKWGMRVLNLTNKWS